MTRKRNTSLGFYIPSFIRMHVGTKKSLRNLNKLKNEHAEAIYIHEFIHFIQDVSTTYGLFNTYVIGEYMRMANRSILASQNRIFQIPIQTIPNDPLNVHANTELAKYISGTGYDDEITITNHRLRPVNIPTQSGPLSILIVEIEYTDSNGKINTFDFGELCISESMAYIVERECYPNCEESQDLPYLAAELLASHIYPNFALSRLNVLALCDVSLLNQNPGEFFYVTLLMFKSNNMTFNKPEDIYDYCFNNPTRFSLPNLTQFEQDTRLFESYAINHITTYLQDPQFVPINNWLKSMIENAVNFRYQNRYFILDIARGGIIKNNNGFKRFFMTIGSPLVTNDKNQTTLHNPYSIEKLNYGLILAIDQVHSLFWEFQIECKLIGFCPNGFIAKLNIFNKKKPKVDKRCYSQPWKRCNDKNLCPFGVIWKHWELTGYSPY